MSHKKCGQYNHRDNSIWEKGFEAGRKDALTPEDLEAYFQNDKRCNAIVFYRGEREENQRVIAHIKQAKEEK